MRHSSLVFLPALLILNFALPILARAADLQATVQSDYQKWRKTGAHSFEGLIAGWKKNPKRNEIAQALFNSGTQTSTPAADRYVYWYGLKAVSPTFFQSHLGQLQTDKHWMLRQIAVDTLAETHTDLPALENFALNDPALLIRYRASVALLENRPARSLDFWKKIIAAPQNYSPKNAKTGTAILVPEVALLALGKLGTPPATQFLLKFAKTSREPKLRALSLKVLEANAYPAHVLEARESLSFKRRMQLLEAKSTGTDSVRVPAGL